MRRRQLLSGAAAISVSALLPTAAPQKAASSVPALLYPGTYKWHEMSVPFGQLDSAYGRALTASIEEAQEQAAAMLLNMFDTYLPNVQS